MKGLYACLILFLVCLSFVQQLFMVTGNDSLWLYATNAVIWVLIIVLWQSIANKSKGKEKSLANILTVLSMIAAITTIIVTGFKF